MITSNGVNLCLKYLAASYTLHSTTIVSLQTFSPDSTAPAQLQFAHSAGAPGPQDYLEVHGWL